MRKAFDKPPPAPRLPRAARRPGAGRPLRTGRERGRARRSLEGLEEESTSELFWIVHRRVSRRRRGATWRPSCRPFRRSTSGAAVDGDAGHGAVAAAARALLEEPRRAAGAPPPRADDLSPARCCRCPRGWSSAWVMFPLEIADRAALGGAGAGRAPPRLPVPVVPPHPRHRPRRRQEVAAHRGDGQPAAGDALRARAEHAAPPEARWTNPPPTRACRWRSGCRRCSSPPTPTTPTSATTRRCRSCSSCSSTTAARQPAAGGAGLEHDRRGAPGAGPQGAGRRVLRVSAGARHPGQAAAGT